MGIPMCICVCERESVWSGACTWACVCVWGKQSIGQRHAHWHLCVLVFMCRCLRMAVHGDLVLES